MKLHPKSASSLEKRSEVVTKAFIKATILLGLETTEILNLTGMSPSSWSRVINHDRLIRVNTKEAELALLFIRIYRSLDALFGGNEEREQAWLRANNLHLDGLPIQLLQTTEGLVKVLIYLDAMRGLA